MKPLKMFIATQYRILPATGLSEYREKSKHDYPCFRFYFRYDRYKSIKMSCRMMKQDLYSKLV